MRVNPVNFRSQGLYWQVPVVVVLLILSIIFSLWQTMKKPKIQVVEKIVEKKIYIKEPCEATLVENDEVEVGEGEVDEEKLKEDILSER